MPFQRKRELVKEPPELARKMRLWRLELEGFPPDYIQWHEALAQQAKAEDFKDYIIHAEFLSDDGWCDGMKFLTLIIEHRKTNRLFKVRWSDGQLWYVENDCHCGWTIFDPETDWRKITKEIGYDR